MNCPALLSHYPSPPPSGWFLFGASFCPFFDTFSERAGNDFPAATGSSLFCFASGSQRAHSSMVAFCLFFVGSRPAWELMLVLFSVSSLFFGLVTGEWRFREGQWEAGARCDQLVASFQWWVLST